MTGLISTGFDPMAFVNGKYEGKTPEQVAEVVGTCPQESNSTCPIRPAWNEGRLMRRRALTDRKIAKYESLGYYSAEYRQARRDLQARKRAGAASRRSGNFDVADDGRLIYRP